MANVAKVLKEEIARISRKETKAAVSSIGKSQTSLKKTVADLKRRLASLEKDNKRLVAEAKKHAPVSVKAPSEEAMKARLSVKTREYQSIMNLLESRMDLSVHMLFTLPKDKQ